MNSDTYLAGLMENGLVCGLLEIDLVCGLFGMPSMKAGTGRLGWRRLRPSALLPSHEPPRTVKSCGQISVTRQRPMAACLRSLMHASNHLATMLQVR